MQNSVTEDQGLIMTAAYPFKVESLGLMIFLCFNQVTVILHIAITYSTLRFIYRFIDLYVY